MKGAIDYEWRNVPKLHHHNYFERAASLAEVNPDDFHLKPYVADTNAAPEPFPPPSPHCPSKWLEPGQVPLYQPPALRARVPPTSLTVAELGYAAHQRRPLAWAGHPAGELQFSVPNQVDSPYIFRPEVDPWQQT